jgi:hypothetical protein
MIRVQADRFIEVGDCFVEVTFLDSGETAIVESLVIETIEIDRPREIADRTIVIALDFPAKATIEIGILVIRLEPDSCVIVLKCAVAVVLVSKGYPSLVV